MTAGGESDGSTAMMEVDVSVTLCGRGLSTVCEARNANLLKLLF